MRRPLNLARIGILLALAGFAAASFPHLARADHTFTTAGGYDFTIDSDGPGDIDGSLRWDSSAFQLKVDGTIYNAGGTAATTSVGGRQVDMAVDSIAGLDVSRHIYVPATGGDYVRFLDVFENPGSTAIDVTVRIESDDLNSDAPTATSSGDGSVDVTDEWFVNGETAGEVWGAVVQATGRRTSVSLFETITTDDTDWEFELTVPAGGRVALLTYVVQADTEADAITKVMDILTLPADIFLGIESYASDILNFGVGEAPVISFTAPAEVDEGQAFTIESDVFDIQGDTATWSWDLDDDGTFGDLVDTSSYDIPAGTTDGPGEITVSIEASDGTNTRILSRSVRIRNVAPEITSEPPATASGSEYRYQVEVADPGGASDPLTFRLGGSPPPGMAINDTGLITWVPPPGARGRTFSSTVRVLDDDGGQDIQTWEIMVSANTPPEPATPVSPLDFARVEGGDPVVLVAQNGTDADGDPLTYSFQISPLSSFETGVIGSGDLPEAEGMTSWTVPDTVTPGAWYWRVSVSDGTASSVYRFGAFTVGPMPATMPDGSVPLSDAGVPDDAGPPPPPPTSGCSASTPGSGHWGWFAGVLGIVALARRRRRRVRALR